MAGDDAPETAAVPPTMIGSYRLVEPLGSGGMSSVFRALHAETGHEVAVKVLPRYLAKNPTLLQRFLREAKSAASLEDPNIVAIYDRGSESGRHYLVLEYVPGGDLHDRVREHGPLAIAEAVDAIRQVARGLRHAAGRGLIHRDIKPANILRTPEGRVKVTDLGLALHTEDEDERVTRDGTTVGTVDYMSPEQARDSRATSVRSDIYSLGCTFYFLLTGQPPFQGGDVADKLRAHATEPAPDARQVRREVPEILARLIRKMMAKRAEKRFADYDVLLEALDAISAFLALPAPAAGARPAPEPLYALIDDEDDEPEVGPLLALIDDDEPGGGPLMALVDDDDGFTLGPGRSRPPDSTATAPILPSRDGLDLASLSALGEGTPASSSIRKPPPAPSGSGPVARPGPSASATAAPPPEDLYDLAPPIAPTPHLYELPPPAAAIDVTAWLIRLGLLALVAMVAWFGWTQLSPHLYHEDVAAVPLDPGSTGPLDGRAADPGAASAPWVEPKDDEPTAEAEPAASKAALEVLGLAGVDLEEPPRIGEPRPVVRRVGGPRGPLHPTDLRSAFDNLGGTVEVADDGPLVEEDLGIAGRQRVVRAAEGCRPIVVLARSDRDSTKARPAAIGLVGQDLVVEGIDFVVDGRAIPPRQQSFFLLKRSGLTLRDCTITVVGPTPRGYAVVQVGDPTAATTIPPSRVRFERTIVRGDATALRLAGAAEVTVARSALIAGKGPVLEIEGNPGERRTLALFRSIVAGRASALGLAGAAGARGAVPAEFRVLESTFASIGESEGEVPPLIGLREVPAGPPREGPIVAWKGDANRFAGWSGLASASPGGVLEALRGPSPGTDRESREAPARWPDSAANPWAASAVPPGSAAVLASPPVRLPTPSPFLREKTVGKFDATAIAPAEPAAGTTLELAFHANDPAWKGDLGRFLAASLTKTARRVLVVASGEGTHAMTPAALPDGVSLEVRVRGGGARPLGWTASETATGPALISVRNASLSLEGVRLGFTPGSKVGSLAAVDHGHLKLARCVLTAPGAVETGAGGLVSFRTDGTRPFPDRASAAGEPAISDRPSCVMTDCVLITGGAAIAAEVGRGIVALSNCAIAAGSDALVLRPRAVRRDRFGADLVLDRCTIASEGNFVTVDAWKGLAPGPDRPWLVRTTGCAFLDAFARGRTPPRAVLLRSDSRGVSRGVLAWQSSGDVYDLTHFAIGDGASPPPSARYDIEHSWIKLWGGNHVVGDRGPKSVRLLVDRLEAGSVAPGDLALDPGYHPGRPTLDAGADLGKMGIAPTVAKFRPAGGP